MKETPRRSALKKLLTLLTAIPFMPSTLFGSAKTFKTGFQNPDIYSFTLGKFKCSCIRDTDVDYPLENFFSNVPKEDVEKVLSGMGLPTNRIYTPLTHLFVDTGKNKILVDTGYGKNLAANLKLAGVDPTQIDSVLITHAHPDHIGGVLDEKGNPIYVNAKYYIWKEEWDFWFSSKAETIAREHHIKAAREKLGPVKDRVIFIEKESEIFPDIKMIAAPGHTPGHAAIIFKSKKEVLYYTGDAVLYPIHLQYPDWLPVYDLVPDKAAVTKQNIFDSIAESKALMVGQQFYPFPSLGQVTKNIKGWTFMPIEKN